MLTVQSQFAAGFAAVGIGYDSVRGEILIYGDSSANVTRFSVAGANLGTFDNPGENANDFDVDFADAAFSMAGVTVPKGSAILINGETGTADISAVDPVTGAVIATLTTAFGNSHVVGGSYHPGRGTFFLVQDRVQSSDKNTIAEIDATTGAVLHKFAIPNTGFTVNYGDLDVDPVTGDLLIVSSDESSLLRLSPEGEQLELLALPNVGGLAGIARIPGTNQAYVISSSGTVSLLSGFDVLNGQPVAVNDQAATSEDEPLTIAVLANDHDPDGGSLTILSAVNWAHGTVAVQGNGTVIYSPDLDYFGQDSFTYTVTDAQGGQDTATVTVVIAQDVDDGEILVNAPSGGAQHEGTIAALAGGGYVISYTTNNGNGDNVDIGLRLFDAGGQPVGNPFFANTTIASFQNNAVVAGLADGGFVAVWQSPRQDTGTSAAGVGAVYGQVFDATGAKVGSEFLVGPSSASERYDASVTGLEGGGFVVVLEDETGTDGVYAQRYDASGHPVGGYTQISSAFPEFPTITALAGGGYVAAWDTGTDGRARLFDADGNPLGAEFTLNSTSGITERRVSVASTGDGGFVAVWEADNFQGQTTEIVARRFDAAGNPIGNDFIVNAVTAGNQIRPSVAGFANGGFIVDWASSGQNESGSFYNVYAQAYNSKGVAVGEPFLVNETTTGFQTLQGFNASSLPHRPTVAVLDDQTVAFTWFGEGRGDTNGTFTRRFAVSFDESGDATDQTLTGGIAADTLSGGGGNDVLIGKAGNDALSGDNGDDVILGGDGDDSIDGGAGSDTASYADAPIGVTVDLNKTGPQNTIGAGVDTLVSIENLTGSAFADTLTGNAANNVIDGGAGDDVLVGGKGADTLSYASASAGVTANLGLAVQNTGGAGTDQTSEFENLTGSAFADTLTGTAGVNVIDGGAGDDVIEGLGGNDILTGGAGSHDVVSYEHSGGQVAVSLAKTVAQGTGGAGNDTISGFEDLTGSAQNDTLTGDAGANIILGLAGNDVIDGGLGDDRLDGGAGTNTASYASVAGPVTVSLALQGAAQNTGAGTDTLLNFANLTGTALGDTLTGDAANNRLTGGNGNDTLEGGLGSNVLDGGAGTDIASYAHASAGVTVNLTVGGAQNTVGAGTDQLIGIESITGSAFADTLTGNDGDNVIRGGDGDDLIKGGLGRDTLAGDAGVDTLTYAFNTAAVTVNLAVTAAQDTKGAGVDVISGFENLIGTGFDDTLTGDTGANSIQGGSGNDLLIGGLGDDRLDGGAGIDTVSYAGAANATAGVTVSLAVATAQATGGAGSDTLVAIENLTGTSFNDSFTGSAAANTLDGGAGNDILSGGAGNDVLIGGAGNDTLDGGANIDTASYAGTVAAVTVNLSLTTAQNTGGAGTDTLANIENLTGGNGNDMLTGSSIANTIDGGIGNDRITGGGGADMLTGGAGNDTFVYLATSDSTSAAKDLITDLVEGDKIDLSAIDADTGTTGDQAFHQVASFGHLAGEYVLGYDNGANQTILSADTNGDATADLVIIFTGNVTGLTSNWVM